jgi:transposase
MRWHDCPVCDLSVHRDINSSCNILSLGLSVRGLTPRSPRL